MQLQVAVKWPFLHRRRSLWMRQKWKDNPVCKLLLVWRGGLMEKGGAGVFSRAVVNPQSLTGYPGEVRICSHVLPCNTAVLCTGCRSWHRSSCFEEWDPQCRLSLSSNGSSSRRDEIRCFWCHQQIAPAQKCYGMISFSALRVLYT